MTTQSKSGNNNSEPPLTARQKLEVADKLLDNYEHEIGLPQFRLLPSVQEEALSLIEITLEKRQKLTPQQCAEAVLVLSVYAAYLGRACQREEARMAWAEEQTDKIVAPRLNQQQGYGFKEKRLLAVRENQHAQEFERIRAESQAKHKRLIFFAQRIEKIAEAYKNLSNVRRRNNEFDG